MALFGEEPPEPAGNTVLRGLYLGVARLRAWFSESEEEYGFVDDDDLRVRLAAALVIDAQNGWAPEHRVDHQRGRQAHAKVVVVDEAVLLLGLAEPGAQARDAEVEAAEHGVGRRFGRLLAEEGHRLLHAR